MTVEGFISRNEGKYFKAELKYDSVFATNAILRPHILIEFSLSDIRLAPELLSIRTIIEETLNIVQLQYSNAINSISCIETAIEKWVALTRKIIAIERGYYHDDPSLIRHVYDLTAIYHKNLINTEFYELALPVIYTDAKQFRHQHPEYIDNPCAEISKSIRILRENKLWSARYDDFLRNMVYGTVAHPEYQESIMIIEKISNNIFKQFDQEDFELLMLSDSRMSEKSHAIRVTLEEL